MYGYDPVNGPRQLGTLPAGTYLCNEFHDYTQELDDAREHWWATHPTEDRNDVFGESWSEETKHIMALWDFVRQYGGCYWFGGFQPLCTSATYDGYIDFYGKPLIVEGFIPIVWFFPGNTNVPVGTIYYGFQWVSNYMNRSNLPYGTSDLIRPYPWWPFALNPTDDQGVFFCGHRYVRPFDPDNDCRNINSGPQAHIGRTFNPYVVGGDGFQNINWTSRNCPFSPPDEVYQLVDGTGEVSIRASL